MGGVWAGLGVQRGLFFEKLIQVVKQSTDNVTTSKGDFMAVKPISPDEVTENIEQSFPDAVLESFNQIIKQNYYRGQSTFYQDDVVALMVAKGLTKKDITAKHYLDVEPIYIAQGWKVEYDKPGYNESYAATFTFKKPKGK